MIRTTNQEPRTRMNKEELGTKNKELDKQDEDCNPREPRGIKS